MSTWTNFRDSVEAFFQPTVEGAVTLAHTIETDAKTEAKGDLAKAFKDAATLYVATPGSFEEKLVAALAAFALELIGDVVTLVKKDASAAVTTEAPAA